MKNFEIINEALKKEQKRYEKVDLPFYYENIASLLPTKVLDFHAHCWKMEHWFETPWETEREGGKYMVSTKEYSAEQLFEDGSRIFADRQYEAVCFGMPTPSADMDKCNKYVSEISSGFNAYPLLIAGSNMASKSSLEQMLNNENFFGYKVFLNWFGDDYGNISVDQMIGKEEMELADALGLVVLLHVPGSKRLADKKTQDIIMKYSKSYPNASIVLAHCGRCYHPDEMRAAVNFLKGLENVYLDTSMVMEPAVLQIIFETINSKRVLFGTDFPIAGMRGRRTYVMDHWVDVVLDGYEPSGFRVASSGIRATFMAYEIVLAIKRAAEAVGLSEGELKGIFYDNGKAVLEHVTDGRQMQKLMQLRQKNK